VIWIAVAVGLLVTLFGASSSAALITVSRHGLAEAVSRRLRGTTEPLDWLSTAERELAAATATTALGVVLLGGGLSAAVAPLSGQFPLWGTPVLLVAVALPFVLFSGYVLPRWLTSHRASQVAALVRPILRPWTRVLGLFLPEPARRHAADVRSLWREGAAGALGSSDELVMVGNLITFAQRPVRDVMTPRPELVAIPEEAGYDEIQAAFAQSGYSRLPVYRGTLDEIVGMVHVFDLVKVDPGQRVPIRPVGAAPAGRTCGDVLVDMQRERRHLTVVLDEFGGTLGIVTLEDLLEAIVGAIFDEFDETTERRAVATATVWEAEGAAHLVELESRFGITMPEGQSRTVGGRLIELIGRVPRTGERFELKGLEFDIVGATPNRIDRLIVRQASLKPVRLDREAE
jgi:CBS domain containing-hemolysin-like protein